MRWECGAGTAYGRVEGRFDKRVDRTINGKRITRSGTRENLSYVVRQTDGDRVPDHGSELEAAS